MGMVPWMVLWYYLGERCQLSPGKPVLIILFPGLFFPESVIHLENPPFAAKDLQVYIIHNHQKKRSQTNFSKQYAIEQQHSWDYVSWRGIKVITQNRGIAVVRKHLLLD